jgi:NADH-quinone oxidoreductase subunit G
MATVYIDNTPFETDSKDNLLHLCLSLGLNLPYFCWHPALGSVGACRQCAVKQFKDENDTEGRIVMACMTGIKDGTRIAIDDPDASAFRAHVIEWLMESHPHDCPICDEGGECHLQDMTVMTGHNYRRFRFKKRTFCNQDLGPFINHEMNRCITCYRCVRFYQEYAGGSDLAPMASKNHVYFGRHEDGALENEFSGNLVEVCPTGVFTDKTLKEHYTRKWDMQTAPSLCVHCGMGCNTIAAERYGSLRRILNRYHSEVNGYFLCDRGRFGYGFVNAESRPRRSTLRMGRDSAPEPVNQGALRDFMGRRLAKKKGEGGRIIGIGSPRASLEANFALRTLVGADHFYAGMADNEQRLVQVILEALQQSPVRPASLIDVEHADAVLILGENVCDTAPRLALALRQAVRQSTLALAEGIHIAPWLDHAVRQAGQLEPLSPLFIATPYATRLDDVAKQHCRAAPDDIARLGFAIAHEIDANAPVVKGLSDDVQALAQEIAQTLKQAQRPLVVSGTGCASEAVLHSAVNVATALARDGTPTAVSFSVPECNTLGLGLMSAAGLASAFDKVKAGEADTVIILENDLYRRAEAAAVDEFFEHAGHVIVFDYISHDTANKAEVLVPAATFAESGGTLVNSEGRAQRFFQACRQTDIRESWRWLMEFAELTQRTEAGRYQHQDDVTRACAEAIPALKNIVDAAPPATFRMLGQKVRRQPHRYSGRTAMHANVDIHEHAPPDDSDSPLAFSMEGYPGQPPAALIPFYWEPGWNSVQSLNKFQEEVAGPLRSGAAGACLFESQAPQSAYSSQIPEAFKQKDKRLLLVPVHHVFGSEELSAQVEAIRERSPSPYVAFSKKDASRLGVSAGQESEITIGKVKFTLTVKINSELPEGIAALPVGLRDLGSVTLPAWGTVGNTSHG